MSAFYSVRANPTTSCCINYGAGEAAAARGAEYIRIGIITHQNSQARVGRPVSGASRLGGRATESARAPFSGRRDTPGWLLQRAHTDRALGKSRLSDWGWVGGGGFSKNWNAPPPSAGRHIAGRAASAAREYFTSVAARYIMRRDDIPHGWLITAPQPSRAPTTNWARPLHPLAQNAGGHIAHFGSGETDGPPCE